jgi:hypothetical protein
MIEIIKMRKIAAAGIVMLLLVGLMKAQKLTES